MLLAETNDGRYVLLAEEPRQGHLRHRYALVLSDLFQALDNGLVGLARALKCSADFVCLRPFRVHFVEWTRE